MATDSPRWPEAFTAMFKDARESAGFTSQRRLATAIGWSRSRVADVESGELPPLEFVQACERVLNINGQLQPIWQQAKRYQWIVEYFEAERRATRILSFQPILFPGLVQTLEYARATLNAGRVTPPPDIDNMVATRLDRQAVFSNDSLRAYWLILDESALHRVIGDEATLREQLAHTVEMLGNPRVKIQLLPFSGGAYPAVGPFTIHEIDDHGTQVHLDGPVQGRTTSDPQVVQDCVARFDLLKAQAASVPDSIAMIQDRLRELQ